MNNTEAQERTHLNGMLDKLQNAQNDLISQINKAEDDIQSGKDYIWQNKADLDGAEKAANRMMVHQMIDSGEQAVVNLKQIERLIESPYFGRVDFNADDRNQTNHCYIGLHTFSETAGEEILIYDWRAPISTLFYDFEKGPATYKAPSGDIPGEIALKRQYKIREGVMEYMIESEINIGDDVLQKELSQSSNEKMKNIVVTIQREQNAIIRNATANTLIVQGVAGSGKTSIALHRVAFLLYRNSETLNSDNMMIISPNKVFADYISNVLPELGEENIQEVDMMDLARELLGDSFAFESFSDQVNFLMQDADHNDQKRISYKATTEFADRLHEYLHDTNKNGFIAQDLNIDQIMISADEIQETYSSFVNLPLKDRLIQTGNSLVIRINRSREDKLNAAVSRKIKNAIIKMFPYKDALSIYANFFKTNDLKKMFKHKKGQPIAYEDVFPLILTRLHIEHIQTYSKIEHLLIDEMQDYTPVQYAVIRMIFPCKKTILGDSNQSVNPYTSTSLDVIRSVFSGAESVKLCRSYRSTMEITNLTQAISKNVDLVPVERHGQEPGIHELVSDKEELRMIRKLIRTHQKDSYQSMGIICKTAHQAKKLYKALSEKFDDLIYLDFDSRTYQDGIVITSAHMAKGLEFDQVIVPHVNDRVYHTQLDRSLLYIACTRAMHRLDLTYQGKPTIFLDKH